VPLGLELLFVPVFGVVPVFEFAPLRLELLFVPLLVVVPEFEFVFELVFDFDVEFFELLVLLVRSFWIF
jgi:hypothetical protein